jgi:hypothetical protein
MGKGAQVGYGLTVKEQPGKGNGLVASRVFEIGEIITQYEGHHVAREFVDMIGAQATHIYSFGKICIDGFKSKEDAKGFGGASFANHSMKNFNSVFFRDKLGNVFLRACKRIQKGEYITANYGNKYMKLGMFTPANSDDEVDLNIVNGK